MEGEKFIACLNFFVDEELEAQNFKEEMHSLVLMHTAVFQKKRGLRGKLCGYGKCVMK